MYQDLNDEIWESLLKAAVIANSQNEIKDYPPEQEINRIVLLEHYSISNIFIGNNEGTFFESQDSRFVNVLLWNAENYYFQLRSTLSKEEMIKIAENLK